MLQPIRGRFQRRSTKSLYQGKLCIDPLPPFFSFLLFFTRGGGNNTFIELQPQPLSGGDQALRVHTFFVFSRASIINFANYREPRFCLLSCLVLKSKDSLGRACSIFFSKIGTNKIEEESYLF